ncbi:MAG: NAD(P)-binding domain-containing protein, partial [bacterium]
MIKEKIGFIGAGNMAEAIIGGMLESRLTEKNNVIAFDIKRDRLDYIGKKFGIKTEINSGNVVTNADIVILSVKPRNVIEALKEIKNVLNGKVVISIAAG